MQKYHSIVVPKQGETHLTIQLFLMDVAFPFDLVQSQCRKQYSRERNLTVTVVLIYVLVHIGISTGFLAERSNVEPMI